MLETPPRDRQGYILPGLAKLYIEGGAHEVSDIVKKHLTNCGIKTTKDRKGPGIRKVAVAGFHSLRHSTVSLLREAGAPLSVTMSIVGHSSLATHDTYTHTNIAAMRQAMNTMPSILPGSASVKALPSGLQATREEKISALVKRLNEKNWKTVKKELIAALN